MNNTILNDNKVVNLDTAKRAFMSNPVASDKDVNINLVEGYLKKLDWKVNENSNMAYSIQGLNNYISSEISKQYWLNKIYPVEIKKSSNPGNKSIKNFDVVNKFGMNVGNGIVLCLCKEILAIDDNNYYVPIEYV